MNKLSKCKILCFVLVNILFPTLFGTSFETLLTKEVLKNVNDKGGRLVFTFPGDDNKIIFIIYYAEKNDVVDENELKTVEYKIKVNTFLLKLEKVQEINKVISEMFKSKSKTKEILKYFTNKNFSISNSYVLSHDPFSPNEDVSPAIKGKDAKKETVRFKLNYSRKDFFPELSSENAEKEMPQLKITDKDDEGNKNDDEDIKDNKRTVLEVTFSFTPDLKKNSVNLESTDPEDLDFHYRFIKKKNVVKYYKKKAFLFKFLGTNNPENAPISDNKPLIMLTQGEGGETEIKDGEDNEEDEDEDDDDDDDDEKKSEMNKSKTDIGGKPKIQAPNKKKAEAKKSNKDKNTITILVIVLVVLAFLVFLLAIVKIYMTSQEHKKMSGNNNDKIKANEKQVDI